MKIRHILDHGNLCAVYFLKKEPWAEVVLCLHQALVARHAPDDEEEAGEMYDEIIGFVVTVEGIIPADEFTDSDRIFMWYVNGNTLADPAGYLATMQKMSHDAYQAAQPPPPPPVPSPVVVQKMQQGKGRTNGKSKRRHTTQASVRGLQETAPAGDEEES